MALELEAYDEPELRRFQDRRDRDLNIWVGTSIARDVIFVGFWVQPRRAPTLPPPSSTGKRGCGAGTGPLSQHPQKPSLFLKTPCYLQSPLQFLLWVTMVTVPIASIVIPLWDYLLESFIYKIG